MHSAASAKRDCAKEVNSICPGSHGAEDWIFIWFCFGSCLKCLLGCLVVNGSMRALGVMDLSKLIQQCLQLI
jgi:hypothetical protein